MTEVSKNNWLKSRQSFITATDCLFILKEFSPQLAEKLEGLNTYNRTRFQLYMEKVIAPEQYVEYQHLLSTPTMQEGKDREVEIANLAKSDLGLRHIEPNGDSLITLEDSKIAATPDYYIHDIDVEALKILISESDGVKRVIDGDYDVFGLGVGVLECKLTAELTEAKMLAYQLQVQQQLLCTGLKWGVIAVAVKESREVGSEIAQGCYYFVKANKTLQQAILDAADAFWKWYDDVANGAVEMPRPNTGNEKDKVLNTFLEDDLAVLCERYMELYIAYQAQDMSFDAVKARLKLYGKGETFTIQVKDGTTYKIPITKRKETVWTEAMKERELQKIQDVEIGSVKTKGSISIGKPEIV